MTFDAKQAVIDNLVDLDDRLKIAKAKQAAEAKANADAVALLEEEIEAWQAFLAGAEKPAAKKATAKK
jgi:hypothetical protein